MSWFLLSSLIAFVGLWWLKLPASSAADKALKLGVITALWGGMGIEITSLFSILGPNTLAAWWTFGLLPAFRFPTQRLSWTCFFWPLIGCMAVYGWQAWFFPPNNYDSMAYHLPRVLAWIQQKDVSFYPTGIPRQLYYNPLAEYLLTHIYLVIGHDQGVNLLQWLALAGCQVTIGLLIKHQGGNTQTQGIGMGLTLLHPMIGFESTTTQNDLLAGFFLLASIYYTLKGERWWLVLALIAGGWVKYTVWILYVPWGVYWIWKEKTLLWKSLLAGVTLACLTLGPFWARNYQKYRHPLGPPEGHTDHINVTNDLHSIPAVLSNLVRTLGNNVGLPIPKWNEWIYQVYQTIHKSLNIDLHDPRTTYAQFFFEPNFSFTEDNAGSIFWLLAILIALAHAWITKQFRWYWICLFGSLLIFNSLLKYQPMHNRLLAGWIIATSLPLALAMEKWKSTRWVWVLLVLLQLPIWIFNKSKALCVPENSVRLWKNQPHASITQADYKKNPAFLAEFYRPVGSDSTEYQIKSDRDLTKDGELVHVLVNELHVSTRPSALASSRQINYFQNRYAAHSDVVKALDWIKATGCIRIELWMGYDAMEYPLRRLILDQQPQTLFYGYQPGQRKGDCLLSMDQDIPTKIIFKKKFTGKFIHYIMY